MLAAPLVMPEVITGLSLLLLFIAMEALLGWPAGRGATTVTIAHITFSMAFVAVIVQARLSGQETSLVAMGVLLSSLFMRKRNTSERP